MEEGWAVDVEVLEVAFGGFAVGECLVGGWGKVGVEGGVDFLVFLLGWRHRGGLLTWLIAVRTCGLLVLVMNRCASKMRSGCGRSHGASMSMRELSVLVVRRLIGW